MSWRVAELLTSETVLRPTTGGFKDETSGVGLHGRT